MKTVWNKFSDIFAGTIFHPQYFLKSYERQAIKAAQKYAKGTLVDIGCGRQLYRKELGPRTQKYIGVDHPKVSLKYKEGFPPDILADATKIPLPSKSADTILMISVLEHLPYPSLALKEAARLAKKGAILILITVQAYPLHDPPYDFFRYTRFSLKKLVSDAGFKIKSIKPLGSFPIFAGQMLNVFLLYKIKDGFKKNSLVKVFSLLSIPPIYILCLISNLTSYVLAKLFAEEKGGRFAIYNLLTATRTDIAPDK